MVFLPLMLIWLRDPMYFNAPSRWAMVTLAVSIGLLAPQLSTEKHGNATASDFSNSSPSGSQPAPPSSISTSSLLREGTRLTNRVGQFSQSDGVWYFTPAQSDLEKQPVSPSTSQDSPAPAVTPSRSSSVMRIRVLENLALQRVAQVIQQDSSDNRWMINGVLTEFFGENRLLMVLAVRAPIDDAAAR